MTKTDEEVRARQFKLWFFRDLSDEQRLKLFAVAGLPVNEIHTHTAQSSALAWIFDSLRASPAPLQAQTSVPAGEWPPYEPQVIEFEEGGYAQLVLEDTAVIHAEQMTVTALRRMADPREIIGFQWELAASPAPASAQVTEEMDTTTERRAYNHWAWEKDGEAVGHLLPHEAAWEAWKARAALHPGREERE